MLFRSGVNNLASKLLLAMLPPNEPFFRLSTSAEVNAELEQQPTIRQQVEKALGKIERDIMIPDELLVDFQIYKRNANRITRNNKIKLFELWDGFDYYDNEFIYKNFSKNPMHRCYPTIDHKISIYQGFINNIDYNKIGSLENLCITKKFLNSKKGFTKECFEFKDSIH